MPYSVQVNAFKVPAMSTEEPITPLIKSFHKRNTKLSIQERIAEQGHLCKYRVNCFHVLAQADQGVE
jgi:hypothetical protein